MALTIQKHDDFIIEINSDTLSITSIKSEPKNNFPTNCLTPSIIFKNNNYYDLEIIRTIILIIVIMLFISIITLLLIYKYTTLI